MSSRGSGREVERGPQVAYYRFAPKPIFLFATLAEEREGMTVGRGVQLAARSGAFRWNLERGPRRCGRRRPSPVKLAGAEFRAFIHRGVPQDE